MPSLDPWPQADPVISYRQVQAITSLGRTTIWRLSKEGLFPPAVRLSERRTGWRLSEIVSWVAERPER